MKAALLQIRDALRVDDPHGHYDLVCEALAEQPAPSVLDGWTIQRKSDNSIVVQAEGIGGVAVHRYASQERLIPEEVLWHLCNALLKSAPSVPEPTVAHVELARRILSNLGVSMSPSREPGADDRVDRIAAMLAASPEVKP